MLSYHRYPSTAGRNLPLGVKYLTEALTLKHLPNNVAW